MTVSPLEKNVENMTEEQYTAWRISLIDENVRLKCLDMELYDILIALNKKGCYTFGSCAGHRLKGRGFIEFASCDMSRKDYHSFVEGIYYLLQELGLRDIQLTRFNKQNGDCPKIEATFAPIGQGANKGAVLAHS